MKNINDILFIVQARVNSERAPQKMIRPFAGTNLFDIALKKIKQTLYKNSKSKPKFFR